MKHSAQHLSILAFLIALSQKKEHLFLISKDTCSSDFRYVAICLVYVSIALGLGNKYYLTVPAVSTGERVKAAVMHIINSGTVAFCILITLIYTFWGRW